MSTTVKVLLCTDEVYESFLAESYFWGGEDVEIPAELWERYKRAEQEFDAIKDEAFEYIRAHGNTTLSD